MVLDAEGNEIKGARVLIDSSVEPGDRYVYVRDLSLTDGDGEAPVEFQFDTRLLQTEGKREAGKKLRVIEDQREPRPRRIQLTPPKEAPIRKEGPRRVRLDAGGGRRDA